MKKLAKWKIYELISSKSIDFFTEFIEATIKKRKNKENVKSQKANNKSKINFKL